MNMHLRNSPEPRHPTPEEIRAECQRALMDDMRQFPFDGPGLPLPVRVLSIIDAAITRACQKTWGL